MRPLATLNATIQVQPGDDPAVDTGIDYYFIDDWTPFCFRVEGKLEDGQLFYGLYGTVTEGPSIYHNLICNITLRVDGSDWRKDAECDANFVVGPSIATRNHAYDFRQPDGIVVEGFPTIRRFGKVIVVTEPVK